MTAPGCCVPTRASAPRWAAAFIPDFLNGGPYSELDNQTTNTNAYGASAQVTNTNDLFGLKNHFVAGVSFDGAQTMFSATSFIGGLTPIDPRIHRAGRGDRRARHQLAGSCRRSPTPHTVFTSPTR